MPEQGTEEQREGPERPAWEGPQENEAAKEMERKEAQPSDLNIETNHTDAWDVEEEVGEEKESPQHMATSRLADSGLYLCRMGNQEEGRLRTKTNTKEPPQGRGKGT